MDANELELENRRLEIDTALRKEALELERRKIEAAHSPVTGWKIILTPTGAAVMAGFFGILGALGGKYLDLRVQNKTQETSVILKASEVPPGMDKEEQIVQRASNLLWFSEAGYISLPEEYVKKLRATSGIKKGQIPDVPNIQTLPVPLGREEDPRFIGSSPEHFKTLPNHSEAGSLRGYLALKAASDELHNSIMESTNPAAIDKYWQAVGMKDLEDETRTLWNIPFICWCFLSSSPGEWFPKTAAGMTLFRELEHKGWKVEVKTFGDLKSGDILFLKRGGIGSTVMIVHHVGDGVAYAILGNSRDAVVGVEVRARTLQDGRLIGVMRPK